MEETEKNTETGKHMEETEKYTETGKYMEQRKVHGDRKVHGGNRKVTLYIEDNLKEDSKLHVHLKH
jgi:hypothetical protein